MTYQQVTGTLNPGGHPGSYNGQDAYSDLLVTEDYERNNLHRKRTSQSSAWDGCGKPELYARPTGHRNTQNSPPDSLLWGGVKRRRLWTLPTTKAQENATERSVKFWQKNLSA